MDSLKARRRAVPPFGRGPSGGGSALALALAATLGICEVARGQTPAPRASPSPAPTPSKSAQPDADDEDPDTPQVTVTAHKLPPQPGAVIGDIKPELQLSPSDVQSYGVSTVTELLNELSPETRSDRGRGGETPVVLLNGRRISSFNEIQNIPTEAILRVDILPEEVSLKYGYTADQRVVNIVLRRRFHAITAEAVGGGATEGGEETGQAELDLLHLHGESRLNLDLKYQATSQITEAARGITEAPAGAPFALGGNVAGSQPGGEIDPGLSALVGEPVTVAGVPISASGQALALSDFVPTAGVPNTTDVGADRTLQPATQQLTANAVMSRPVFWGFTATFNATLGASTSAALQGLPSLALLVPPGDPFSPFGDAVTVDRYIGSSGPLRQTVTGWTAHLGSTLNRDLGDWRLSLTDAYDHADTQTNTEVGVAAAPLQTLLDTLSPAFDPFTPPPSALVQALPETLARSLSDSANIQVLTNGPLLKIPAGPVYVSAKLGDTASVENSTSLRLGAFQALSLSRNDVNAQFNFDLPLTSRSNHVFGVVGDLSVNVNTAVDVLSDFGVLPTFGYGVNWTPVEGVNLIVSHTHDHAAPTLQQLDGPVIYTPGVRLFDYATGQTVDVTQVTGGQPALTADNRNVIKIGLTLKPLASENFTVTANYIHSVIDNPIETFPAADAAIEAAFPDRFIRNAEGELTEEDDRPVNFASQDREELRWGLNYSRPLGPQPPPRFDRRRFAAARQRQAAAEGAGAAGGASGEASGGPSPGPGGGSGAGPDLGGRPRGGGGRFGGGAPAAGRLQFAIYHTIIFKDQFLVRSGGPVLDLLNGAPASSTGGQYQQEVQAQLGATLFGFGARLSADWRSATVVKGASGLAADTLSFSDIATINLRLFDNLGQQKPVLARFPWLRGARVTLNVLNLFDQRIEVRDGVGVTPLSYQGGYLDPVGRTITLSLRKLFY